MVLTRSYSTAALLAAALIVSAGSLQAQTIQGPVLGYAFEESSGSIRPIFGTPGATLWGDRLPIEPVRSAAISPDHKYAVVTAGPDGTAFLLALHPTMPVLQGHFPEGRIIDVVAFSPRSETVALVDLQSKRAEAFEVQNQGLADPADFDLSGLGEIGSLSISDDGQILAVATRGDERSLYAVSRESGARVVLEGASGVLRFAPGSHQLFLGNDQNGALAVFPDFGATAAYEILATSSDFESGAELAISMDGRKAFWAAIGASTVSTLSVGDREVRTMHCNCVIEGLWRLRGDAVFRLTNFKEASPAWVLDSGSPEGEGLSFVPALVPFRRGQR